MRELALNVLDIAENSVKANASLIVITIEARKNLLTIAIADNGKGMDKAFLARVTDPFTTTRTTRKVGMGIPLFKEAAEMTGGRFSIDSELGIGTTVTASFVIDSIDRAPLGDIAESAVTLLRDDIDFVWVYTVNDKSFTFDTREVKRELGGIPITSPEIIKFLKDMLEENIESINGGIIL